MSGLGPYAAQAQVVYDVAFGLDAAASKRLDKLGWDAALHQRGYRKAQKRLLEAAENSGRYEAAFGLSGRWGDAICGTFAQASDVQMAVLCRDLITDDDYRQFLGWWVQGGLTDPHGVVR